MSWYDRSLDRYGPWRCDSCGKRSIHLVQVMQPYDDLHAPGHMEQDPQWWCFVCLGSSLQTAVASDEREP